MPSPLKRPKRADSKAPSTVNKKTESAWYEVGDVARDVFGRLTDAKDLLSAEAVCKAWHSLQVALPSVNIRVQSPIHLQWLQKNVSRVLDLQVEATRTNRKQQEATASINHQQLARVLAQAAQATKLDISGLEVDAYPEGILSKLPQLQQLTFSYSNHLLWLPLGDIGKLTSLQELNIVNCSTVITIDDGVTTLTSLTALKIICCRSLAHISPGIGVLHKLQHLQLADCDALGALPSTFGQLKALTALKLEYSVKYGPARLSALPSSVGDLSSLAHMTIKSGDLQALPDTLGNLTALTLLSLECQSLLSLPGSISRLSSLQHLTLHGFRGSEYDAMIGSALPDVLGTLMSVTYLCLHSCPVDRMPHTIGHLSSLQHLSIQGLRYIESLPGSLGALGALTQLHLSQLGYLRHLPHSIGVCAALRLLTIDYCLQLETLPDTLTALACLEQLNIHRCGIEALPAVIGKLCSLKSLVVKVCRQLQALPDGICGVTALQHLELVDCYR